MSELYLREIGQGSELRIFETIVTLMPDLSWKEAIARAGPNTSVLEKLITVEKQFVPINIERPLDRKLYLINFKRNNGDFEKAREWAIMMHLENTTPREVFAFGRSYPGFHGILGTEPAHVIATTPCYVDNNKKEKIIQACYVRSDEHGRGAGIGWFEGFIAYHDWFAFRIRSSGV